MRSIQAASAAIIFVAAVGNASAAPVLMSAEWARLACDAWNAEPVLTDKLVDSGWAGNDKERGYKVMHVYRTDCDRSQPVEMRISVEQDKAKCVYGGSVENEELDDDIDYLMHASTERWQQMGAGDYGPMRAMIFGRLKFTGPKWEAMKNMGPFEKFLQLTGVVESDTSNCP